MSSVTKGAMLFVGTMFSFVLINPIPFLIAIIAIIFIGRQEQIIVEVEEQLGESQRGCGWQIHSFVAMCLMLFLAFCLFAIVVMGEHDATEMMKSFAEFTEDLK